MSSYGEQQPHCSSVIRTCCFIQRSRERALLGALGGSRDLKEVREQRFHFGEEVSSKRNRYKGPEAELFGICAIQQGEQC